MTLDDDDIEAIASLVAQKLRAPRLGLVTATELAQALGVSKTFVYEHAAALGARRLGTGSRARLRFDLEKALAATEGRTAAPAPGASNTPRRRGRPRRSPLPPDVELLQPRRL